MPGPKYPGADLLGEFIDKNGIAKEAAAKALRVTRVTLWSWLTKESDPSEKVRPDIETWTNGFVPVPSWPPVRDRRKLPGDVKPFEPAPETEDDDAPKSEPKPAGETKGSAA